MICSRKTWLVQFNPKSESFRVERMHTALEENKKSLKNKNDFWVCLAICEDCELAHDILDHFSMEFFE